MGKKTRVAVKIFGSNELLNDFVVTGIINANTTKIKGNTLVVIWNGNHDNVCDSIADCERNIDETKMELLGLNRGPLMPYHKK